MDKYKLGIGDAEYLNLWHVLTKFKKGLGIMEAIEATIAEDFDGAVLGKLVTIEDRVKVCMAFIRFVRDVEPQQLFKLAGEGGSEGPAPEMKLIEHRFTENGDELTADMFESGADGFSKIWIDVRTTAFNSPQPCNVEYWNDDQLQGRDIDVLSLFVDGSDIHNFHEVFMLNDRETIPVPYTCYDNVWMIPMIGDLAETFIDITSENEVNCHYADRKIFIDDITQPSSITLALHTVK